MIPAKEEKAEGATRDYRWELIESGRSEKSFGGNILAETEKTEGWLVGRIERKNVPNRRNSTSEDMRVRESMLLFRNWRTLFMEGAGGQSVYEFEGMMWMNG